MNYKGYIIRQYVIIYNGLKYSVTAPDGITHIGSARNLKDAKILVNQHIQNN